MVDADGNSSNPFSSGAGELQSRQVGAPSRGAPGAEISIIRRFRSCSARRTYWLGDFAVLLSSGGWLGVQFLAAAPVVAVVTVMFCQCAELLLAERLLMRAATAAAEAATLPAADHTSIQSAVRRVLSGSDLHDCVERPIIWVNGQPTYAGDVANQPSGTSVEVFLTAYVTDVVPDVLRPLGLSLAGRRLSASRVCVKP